MPSSHVQRRHFDAPALRRRLHRQLGELNALGSLGEVPGEGQSLGGVLEEQLPLDLEAVVERPVVGHVRPLRQVVDRMGRSGFHTGIGVLTRCWTAQLRRPATALPAVPSTCSSTSSLRLTRTAQEELTEATAPPANSSSAYAASSAVTSYCAPRSSQRTGT